MGGDFLSSFLPCKQGLLLNAGNFGSYSWNGFTDGLLLSSQSLRLSLLAESDSKLLLPNICNWCYRIRSLSTVVTLIDVFGVNKYAVNFNGWVGFQSALISSLLWRIYRYCCNWSLAMSGGKITKGTFESLLNLVKDLPNLLDAHTSTVKPL